MFFREGEEEEGRRRRTPGLEDIRGSASVPRGKSRFISWLDSFSPSPHSPRFQPRTRTTATSREGGLALEAVHSFRAFLLERQILIGRVYRHLLLPPLLPLVPSSLSP